MQTLIERTKVLATQPSTKFKVIVGHGVLTGTYKRVPEDTYIIFLSKPGHLISQGSVIQNPQLLRNSYLRSAISGVLPRWSIAPTRLGAWKEHVYGPLSLYPDMSVNFFDHDARGIRTNGTPYNRLTGLHTMRSNNSKTTTFKGTDAHISNVIRLSGKGIYIVAACRASAERSFAGAMGAFRKNLRLTGGNQTSLRRIGRTDPLINMMAQNIENSQARIAAHKRTANKSPNRTTPPKRMKPMFTFTPGRPATASTARRRPKTLRRT
jgi:hypothetical protein